MDLDRFHIDRVSAYSGTLPSYSGTLRFNPDDDGNRLNGALCVAANLHNPALTASLTKNRSITESADDLVRIADHVDEPTAASMRRVARILRNHTAQEAHMESTRYRDAHGDEWEDTLLVDGDTDFRFVYKADHGPVSGSSFRYDLETLERLYGPLEEINTKEAR